MAIDRTVPQWLLTPWLFGLLAVLLYANTIGNQFALDDGLVLNDNAYVLKGIAGIPDILTHDSFHGAVGETDKLSGGRYRPLSLVTLAVEVHFPAARMGRVVHNNALHRSSDPHRSGGEHQGAR